MSNRQAIAETTQEDLVSVVKSDSSGTNVPMLRVTTTSGAMYLIDRVAERACRVNSVTAPEMRFDGDWFEFSSVTAHGNGGVVVDDWVGARLYFVVRNHPTWSWRLTTPVLSVATTDELGKTQ